MLEATLFSDPACPWAYSATPALTALRWRYGAGLRWRLVTIGLAESAERYLRAGYTPERAVQGYARFARYGMPFSFEPKARMAATARACRAIVATRLRQPGLELDAYRALQLAWFTTPLVLDEDDQLERALGTVAELDAAAIVAALDDPDVDAAYEADRAAARTAAGSPTEAQGKAANTDGSVRYTAPSVTFHGQGARLEAGGFQPLEAYDVLIANLDPALPRRPAPDQPLAVLDCFPNGLTTAEVAAVMASGNDAPDRDSVDAELSELAASGAVERRPLGNGALWLPRHVALRAA